MSGESGRVPGAARRNLVIAGMVVVVLALLYVCAVQFLPDTWAHAAGRQSGGSLTSGLGWGIFYGFIFTFFPVLVIGFACYRRGWETFAQRVFVALVGVLLSAPNLLTAGIVFGRTSEAAAARQVLDTQAPGFAWATLIAAVVAFLGGLTLWILASVRRSADQRLRALRRAHGLPEREPRPRFSLSGLLSSAGQSGSTGPASPARPTSSTGRASSAAPRPAAPAKGTSSPASSSSLQRPTPTSRSASAASRPASNTRSSSSAQSERERAAARDRAAERNAQKAGAYGRLAARGVHRIRKKLREQQRDDR